MKETLLLKLEVLYDYFKGSDIRALLILGGGSIIINHAVKWTTFIKKEIKSNIIYRSAAAVVAAVAAAAAAAVAVACIIPLALALAFSTLA